MKIYTIVCTKYDPLAGSWKVNAEWSPMSYTDRDKAERMMQNSELGLTDREAALTIFDLLETELMD